MEKAIHLKTAARGARLECLCQNYRQAALNGHRVAPDSMLALF